MLANGFLPKATRTSICFITTIFLQGNIVEKGSIDPTALFSLLFPSSVEVVVLSLKMIAFVNLPNNTLVTRGQKGPKYSPQLISYFDLICPKAYFKRVRIVEFLAKMIYYSICRHLPPLIQNSSMNGTQKGLLLQ